jgi:hypothetical protein
MKFGAELASYVAGMITDSQRLLWGLDSLSTKSGGWLGREGARQDSTSYSAYAV